MTNPLAAFGLKPDALIATFRPYIEQSMKPMFDSVRNDILCRVAGTPPPLFSERLAARWSFTAEEIVFIWQSAVDAASTKGTY